MLALSKVGVSALFTRLVISLKLSDFMIDFDTYFVRTISNPPKNEIIF